MIYLHENWPEIALRNLKSPTGNIDIYIYILCSKVAIPIGIAKEIPAVTFILLTPIASPSKFTRGPPELPNVIAASV